MSSAPPTAPATQRRRKAGTGFMSIKPGTPCSPQRDGEMRWMPRIQQALADERFRLYYQPILPVGSDAPAGARGEILIRMIDEAGHIVPPGAFLPAAERYGLMLALDRWVVRRSLEALSANSDLGGRCHVRDQHIGTVPGCGRLPGFRDRADRCDAGSGQQGLLRDHRNIRRIGARPCAALHRHTEGAWLPIRAGRLRHRRCLRSAI